jgi:hypothetical protein
VSPGRAFEEDLSEFERRLSVTVPLADGQTHRCNQSYLCKWCVSHYSDEKNPLKQAKDRFKVNEMIFSWKAAHSLQMPQSNAAGIIIDDLRLESHKTVPESLFTSKHKTKMRTFIVRMRNHSRKVSYMHFLFPMKKYFIWTVFTILNMIVTGLLIVNMSRENIERKHEENFLRGWWLKLAVCSTGVSSIVGFVNDSVEHDHYMREVLPHGPRSH